MLPDVIRLEPLLASRPWGGRRLERFGRNLPADVPVGESWELADLGAAAQGGGEDACTRVAAGPLAGATLSELIGRSGSDFLGSAAPTGDGRFPLLVKLLDAREHLSVQVHPSDSVAGSDPSARSKTESWYVIDAAPGSVLWLDIRADVADAEFAGAVGRDSVVPMLGQVPAGVGDFHHIPPGRVHSLGAGVMVLEIQTPSDTTYRLYDWTEEYQREPRDLHVEAGLASVVRGDAASLSAAATTLPGSRDLVRGAHYWIREHHAGPAGVDLDDRPELRVVSVISGEVALGEETLVAGETRLLPAASAAIGHVDTSPGAVVIETGLV